MSKLTLNSISPSVFVVNAADGSGIERQRADIVAKGRVLAYEHAVKGKNAMLAANGKAESAHSMLTQTGYRQLNEKFQQEHLLYAARITCQQTGEAAPTDFDDFRRNGQRFFRNRSFYRVLQGIYQEIVTPIIPAVYSEAVDMFAETVEVGFGETHMVSVGSNDIPVFQDSSWGASRSVPRNRFYSKDYTLQSAAQDCADQRKVVPAGRQQSGLWCILCKHRRRHVCKDHGHVECSTECCEGRYNADSVQPDVLVRLYELDDRCKPSVGAQQHRHRRHFRHRLYGCAVEGSADTGKRLFQREHGRGSGNASWRRL